MPFFNSGSAHQGAFHRRLNRLYGTFTLLFVAFVLLLAILEHLGLPFDRAEAERLVRAAAPPDSTPCVT